MRKLIRAVQEMRKEKGLHPVDEIVLTLSSFGPLGDTSLLLSTCKVKKLQEDANVEGVKVELSEKTITVSIS
jgi:hypothetical protein